MRLIINGINDGNMKPGCVLSIGNFDGVHLGHQHIINRARELADRKGVEVAAMTFEPHPAALLIPGKAPAVLTPIEYKSQLLEKAGVNCLIIIKDNLRLLEMSPEEFVDEFLGETVRPSVLVEGEDFNFGKDRSGNVDTLRELGRARGFELVEIRDKETNLDGSQGVRVSSTLIRQLLEIGQVSLAEQVLGRPYKLFGQIFPGKGRGRELGFPTANLETSGQIVPANGVYAGYVQIGDSYEQLLEEKQAIPAAFSIGHASTIGKDKDMLIEAHLLKDDVEQLQGKWMAMNFVNFVRSQHKFKSESELVNQIRKDCEKIKQILVDYKT